MWLVNEIEKRERKKKKKKDVTELESIIMTFPRHLYIFSLQQRRGKGP